MAELSRWDTRWFSGTRILVTMLSVLKERGIARRRLAGICIGGGEALAMCLERP